MKKLLLAAVLFFCATPSHAQTFVRHSTLCDGNGATVTCSFASNTATNTILIVGQCRSTTCTPTAADSALNSYSRVVLQSGGTNASCVAWEADNIAASAGANTITITTGSISTIVEGFEYSGLASSAFDKMACTEGISGNENSGPTATTSFANELVFDCFINSTGGAMTPSDGTTTRSTDFSNTVNTWSDKNITSTGVQTATATSISATWMALVATFKSSSQPGSSGTGLGGKAGMGGKAGIG